MVYLRKKLFINIKLRAYSYELVGLSREIRGI